MALKFLNNGYFAGKVGIGTNSPGAKLEVAEVTGATVRLTSTGDGLGADATIGSLEYYGSDVSVPGAGVKSSIVAKTEASLGDDSNLIFSTSDGVTNNTERMRIASDGNVGIGTTSPQSKLHIETGSGGTYSPNANHDDVTIEGSDNIGLQLFSPATSYQYIAFGDPDSVNAGYLRYHHGTNEMVFRTNGSDNMVIDNGGNVGIGTSSPDMPLSTGIDQNNQAIFGQDRAAGESTIYIGSEAASNKSLGITFDNDNVKAKLYVGGDKSKNPLVITDGGNVGIGTDSTSRRLTVNSGIQQVAALIEGTSSLSTQINIRNGNSNTGGFIKTTGDNVILTANNTGLSHLVVADGGNVGIGTESPGGILEVAGNTDIDDNFLIIKDKDSTAGSARPSIRFAKSDGTVLGQLLALDGTNQRLQFSGNNTQDPHLTVYNDGNVGIGTTSPQSKLQVAGGIQMADDTDIASANKVGTMRYRTGTEYVEVTGTEMVTNGDFATDTNWSKNSGVTISGGTMNFTSTPGHYGSQNINFTNGAKYKINFEITAETSGTLTVFLGAGNNVGSISGVGKKEIIATGNSSLDTKVYFGNNFTGSIDNVSVVEVTEEEASYADMCMQTGSSTYEWVNIVRNTY